MRVAAPAAPLAPALAPPPARRRVARGAWPWGREPAPPQQQPGARRGAPPPPPGAPSVEQDLLRASPKWRGWPAEPQGPPPQQQQQQQQRGRPAQQQLSPEQQAALRDMVLESTVNPKWRWPSFGGAQPPPPPPPPPPQQQQRGRGRAPGGPAPPPPPPPPGGRWRGGATSEARQRQAQRRAAAAQAPPPLPRRAGGWFGSRGAGAPPPEVEFREQLEALGVDVVGSRAREAARKAAEREQQERLGGFEGMDDREVAALMAQLRSSRLEKVAARQDDEVVGIAGFYLAGTLLLLAAAVLANLPL
ncbi:hypothetical protein HT031_006780 [Scenedesmus sp. PABB004]|nr:hypothetical protein HT031_006780 [Scenedesmus sp. PABB004]